MLTSGMFLLVPRWWKGALAGDGFFTDHLNRAFLANACFVAGLTLIVGVGVVEDSDWVSTAAARAIGLVLLLMTLGSAALILSIYFLNWPKWMVPPRMRAQQGRLSAPRAKS